MDEQLQGGLVKVVGLGKSQSLAHKAGQTLSQGVVPALDVGGFSCFLANGAVRCGIKGQLIRFPEVAAGATGALALGDALAQSAPTVGATVADKVGDDLSGATTEGNPEPALIALCAHK